MPAPTTVTVGKAISMLRSAIVNARIYPKGSQMIEGSLKGAQQALESCLEETSPIVISDIGGKLCVNGKELSEIKDFRPFLVQHDVHSLKFLKGIQIKEVASLLDALGRRKDQFGDHKNLGGWLSAEGASHVQVEDVEFVEVKKGEVVVQQVMALLEQSSSDVPTLMNSLEESYRMIDQLPDDASKKEVRGKVAKQLSTLPPYQLKELFETKLPDSIDQKTLKEDVIQAMSKEKLEETLEEVNKWYQQIKQETSSEFEVVEKLNSLKSFLGKVLHSPVSKTVPFALYEELLNVGLLEEMPAGVEKGEQTSLVKETEKLLSQPSEALLEPAVRQRFPDLLKALCAMAMDEPLQKLTDHVLENLQNPAPVARETAVKTVRIFEEILSANRKEKPFMQIVGALHKMAETESAPDVYGDIAQGLQVAAMELLVNWRFEESAMLLSTLRRHSREESPIGQKKKQLAAKALRDFSVRGLDVICADLNAPIKDRQNGSYRVLAELGEEAVAPLVEAIKRSVDSRAKQAAIQAIKRLGVSIKEPLLRQMNVGMSAEALTKLIPVLEDFADASLLPTLQSLMQHPDASVRRQIAQLLGKVKEPRVQALLTTLLDDADSEVQAESVRVIGELRLKAAAPDIAAHLSAAGSSVQEEMCIALGMLVEKKVVPELVSLLQNQGSFWKRTTGTADAVRLRAVWALGQLMPDDTAHKALTKALKDSNVNIQRAAQLALQRSANAQRAAA
jgi:HEAT repeat protein